MNGESYLEMLRRYYHILHPTVEEKKDISQKQWKTCTSNRMEPLFTALRMSYSTLYLEHNSHHLKEMWVQLTPLFTIFKSVRFFMGHLKELVYRDVTRHLFNCWRTEGINQEGNPKVEREHGHVHGRVWQFSGSWSMCKIIELYNYWTASIIYILDILNCIERYT